MEDVARSYGLNSLPLQLPALDYKKAPLHENERILGRIEPCLLGNGFFEVMTKSYYSQEVVAFLNELQPGADLRHMAIKNSMEREYSHLKITNLIHLARLSEYNVRRGVSSFKVYEFARLFSTQQESSSYQYEKDVLSLAVAKRWNAGEWKEEEPLETKILLLKGVLEALHSSLGGELIIKESSIPFLHPGCQASLYVNDTCTGFFGLMHPQLKNRLQLDQDLLYAEIDVDALKTLSPIRSTTTPSEFPSIKRDLTLKLSRKSLATAVIDCIKKASPQHLQDVIIINSFEKKDEDFRRVTYRLSFQRDDRTLQHTEVDAAIEKLVLDLKVNNFSLCS
jgi:phenylalanyl-tRNA synthetase beta chain